MKTKFRTFLMSLVLIPCIFIFAGCNAQLDQKVSLDTRGNYTDATAGNAKAAVEESDIADVANEQAGFRLSMDFSMSSEEVGSINGSITNLNTIKELNATQNKLESAMRMRMSGKMENQNFNMQASTYSISTIDSENSENNTIANYIDFSMSGEDGKTMTGKYKYEDEIPGMDDFAEIPQMMLSLLSTYLPTAGSTSSWNALWNNNEYKYAVATSGKTTKVRITTPEVKEGNTVIAPAGSIYYIIEDGKFQGVQTEKLTMTMFGMSITFSFGFALFDGNIEMPNFADYQEYVEPAL